MHIEWTTTQHPAELTEDDFADDFGTTVDQGTIGLLIGGTVVEGTREELAAWLLAAHALVASEARCTVCGEEIYRNRIDGVLTHWAHRVERGHHHARA